MGKKFVNITAVACLSLLGALGNAQGVKMIDDFQSYPSGNTGNWTSTSSGISVALGLGLNSGQQYLTQSVGIGALGSNYTVFNNQLNVDTPATLEKFVFKQGALVAINITRNVQVTLTKQGGTTFVSPQINLPVLSVGASQNLEFNLNQFTPPANGGVIGKLTGVSIKYTIPVISIVAQDYIDDVRFTYDNSSVADWTMY